jgi:hypothetical protein
MFLPYMSVFFAVYRFWDFFTEKQRKYFTQLYTEWPNLALLFIPLITHSFVSVQSVYFETQNLH